MPRQLATVADLMRPALGVFPETVSVAEARRWVGSLGREAVLTYLYVTDAGGCLSGVVVLRELFTADGEQRLADIMLRHPFSLRPEQDLVEAARVIAGKQFPDYPVCDAAGKVVGLLRGQALFEQQLVTVTAQPGKLVGVPQQDTVDAGFWTSVRMRLPWLKLNLFLSLLSALVVLAFKEVLAQYVILAVFLSVISTQGRNSGAQTMALTLRDMADGRLSRGRRRRILVKECALGALNGLLVGLVAAGAIWIEAWYSGEAHPLRLAGIVWVSMAAGCGLSCAVGVVTPLAMRRLGADPALASGILMSNICTVLCQSLFLAVAFWSLGRGAI